MTEYGFCGLVFFGALMAMLVTAVAGHFIQAHKNKKALAKAKKAYRCERALEYSAEVAALASIYEK